MRKGYTLVELLLVMALIALMAGMVMANYTGASSKRQFSERTDRFVTLIKALRAQSALDGHRYRIEFLPVELSDDYSFVVTSEKYPLEAPGEFSGLSEGVWMRYFDTKDLLVRSCVLDHNDALVAAVGGADTENSLLPVTFYPDGSSDSAEIVLVSGDSRVTHGIKITIDGTLGRVNSARLSADILKAGY